MFVGISAFELGNCAAALMILRATDLLEPRHGIDDATTIAIALYVVYNVSATVTSVAAGHASDRRTPRLVLALGAAAFGFLAVAMILATALIARKFVTVLSGECVGESLDLAEADVDGEVGEDIGHLGAISKLHGRAGG